MKMRNNVFFSRISNDAGTHRHRVGWGVANTGLAEDLECVKRGRWYHLRDNREQNYLCWQSQDVTNCKEPREQGTAAWVLFSFTNLDNHASPIISASRQTRESGLCTNSQIRQNLQARRLPK